MIVISILLILIIILAGVLYVVVKQKKELVTKVESGEDLWKIISLDNKTNKERQKELDILKVLKNKEKCMNSDNYPAINFWENDTCKSSEQCMAIFKDTLKDVYESNEIPKFDKEKPQWTIGIWVKSKKITTGAWRNVFRFMKDNAGSLEDRRPGFWLHPKENILHMPYAIKGTAESSGANIKDVIKEDEWFHMVWVQDNAKTYIYINGVLRKVVTQTSPPEIVDDQKLFIGPRNSHLVKNMTVCAIPMSSQGVMSLHRITSKLT